jgi:hypothetical protein
VWSGAGALVAVILKRSLRVNRGPDEDGGSPERSRRGRISAKRRIFLLAHGIQIAPPYARSALSVNSDFFASLRMTGKGRMN